MRRAMIALLLVVGGCANHLVARRAYLNSLVGESELQLVRQMGVPTRSFALDGEKFLAYDHRWLEFAPGFYAGPPWWGPGWGPWGWGASPPLLVQRGCETTFEIIDGKVASYSLRGDSCG